MTTDHLHLTSSTQSTAISRRALGRGALGILALTAATATGIATVAPAHAELPVVSMKSLLVAALVDTARPDGEETPGAGASVRPVEDALVARGLLDPAYVDGSFGSRTVAAYAAFQESLGHSGLGANGLPGLGSLRALGDGRFTVADEIVIGQQVEHRGVTLNERTRDMLEAALGRLDFEVELSQGSYHPGTSASAQTHDGGGAVDVAGASLSPAQRTAVARAMREVGFAAWVRTPAQKFEYHVHGMAIADPDIHPSAFYQIADYYLGRDGLSGHEADDGPQVARVVWEDVRPH